MISSGRRLAGAVVLTVLASTGCAELLVVGGTGIVNSVQNPKRASWDEPPPPDVPPEEAISDCMRQQKAWLEAHRPQASPPADLRCQPSGDYPGVAPRDLPSSYYLDSTGNAQQVPSAVPSAPSIPTSAAPAAPQGDVVVTP